MVCALESILGSNSKPSPRVKVVAQGLPYSTVLVRPTLLHMAVRGTAAFGPISTFLHQIKSSQPVDRSAGHAHASCLGRGDVFTFRRVDVRDHRWPAACLVQARRVTNHEIFLRVGSMCPNDQHLQQRLTRQTSSSTYTDASPQAL